MDQLSEILIDIDLKLQAIESHANQMTTANFSHHNSFIKGAAQLCREDLKEIKILQKCSKNQKK